MSHKNKNKILFFISIFIYALVNGCSQPNSLTTPTLIFYTPKILPISPTLPHITTATVSVDVCKIEEQGEIQVISQPIFTALSPGGSIVFDHVLAERNQDWVDFEQEVSGEGFWSAGQIFASFAWGYELGTGVNPAVIFITYGVEKDWNLPTNDDLISEVDYIRGTLRQYESDWILGKVDKSQYPPIANAASYALYRYFNGDLSKLENWCATYIRIYRESPLE
jgi:hypothetical protein